jgi:hypothetical protein
VDQDKSVVVSGSEYFKMAEQEPQPSVIFKVQQTKVSETSACRNFTNLKKCLDNVFCIAIRNGLDGQQTASFRTDSVAQPASFTMGSGALSLGLKQSGRGVDNPPHLELKLRMSRVICLLLCSRYGMLWGYHYPYLC